MSYFSSKFIAVLSLVTLGVTPGFSQEPGDDGGEPPKTKKIAYLGVLSCPLENSLRQHLGLAEGFGLQVKKVLEDGPAANGVLEPHDVLTEVDGQRLTTVTHLALLVRSFAPDEKVSLTFIRKGKEETVEVVLGEREVADQPFFAVHPLLKHPVASGNSEEWQHAVQCYQDSLNQWLQQNGGNPQSKNQKNPQQGVRPPEPGSTGRPPAISVRPGFPIQVFGSSGIVKIDNGFGEVTIKSADAGHQITVKDEKGAVIHEGAYDAEKGTEGLPEDVQKHLEKMKLDDLKILVPSRPVMNPPSEKGPEKESEVEKISEPIPAVDEKRAQAKIELL